jgi:hypothetical protein
MNNRNLERQRELSEIALKDNAYDFSAKYIAVWHINSLVETNPEVINGGTISALEHVLQDPIVSHQTQAYFLYKHVSNTLCSMIIHSEELAEQAFSSLKRLLEKTNGHPHRAVAESLGSLPFSVQGPELDEVREDIPSVNWRQICDETGLTAYPSPKLTGRSLVVTLPRKKELLVIKLARIHESVQSLHGEPLWMEHLKARSFNFPIRFNVPKAIKIAGSYIFRLQDIPVEMPRKMDIHPEGYAIGFIADKDYFTYPNDTRKERRLAPKEFREVMCRNAWLLGRLTSLGIVHSAPIPLFHNQVQSQRRRDHGLYEWFRAGRLHAWLDSCLYPNLGLTGIRDFEHFVTFKGLNQNLYRYIGTHLLSLFLIAGSYFRNKERERVGLDNSGEPVDVRYLFDKYFFKELIRVIFLNYYHGFVERQFRGEIPVGLDELTIRMIDEMGIDRHMEEILRVADQKEMTDKEFRDFLRQKGYSKTQAKTMQKGIEDITILSGPHLGEFNHRISLPELIESVGTMSALCIVGRYLKMQGTYTKTGVSAGESRHLSKRKEIND